MVCGGRSTGRTCPTQRAASPPPLELTPSRCTCAALVTPPDWSVLFGFQFRAPHHINALELTALTSLVEYLAHRGTSGRAQTEDLMLRRQPSRSPPGGLKGHSSSRRLHFGLWRLAFECLSASLSIDLLWVPSWRNPADAPSRGTSLAHTGSARSRPGRHKLPTLQFGSPAVARELKLLHEPLPSAAVQKLGACYQPEEESSGKRTPAAMRGLCTINSRQHAPCESFGDDECILQAFPENVVPAVFQPTEFTRFSS